MNSSEVYVVTVYRDSSKDGEEFILDSLDKVRNVMNDCFSKGYGYLVEKRSTTSICYLRPLDFKSDDNGK